MADKNEVTVPRREQVTRIHFSQLGPCSQDSKLSREWEFYRREVGRLLAEGREGQWVLIKGEEIVGFYPECLDALKEGLIRYENQPFLTQQVRTFEPIPRFSTRMLLHKHREND